MGCFVVTVYSDSVDIPLLFQEVINRYDTQKDASSCTSHARHCTSQQLEYLYRSKESTVSRYNYSVNIYGIPRIPYASV